MNEITTNRQALIADNPQLVDLSRQFYRDDVEYHNFDGHILDTWEVARHIASACMSKGHTIGLMVLDADVLFHDSNVHVPLKSSPFKTLERRSAWIARGALEELDCGYTTEQIKQVSGDIIATTNGIRPDTREGAILNRADIANIGFTVGTFLDTSVRIIKEYIQINELASDLVTVRRWLENAPLVLRGLLNDTPEVPDFDLSLILAEDPPFYERGIRNIDVLANQTAEDFLIYVKSVGKA